MQGKLTSVYLKFLEIEKIDTHCIYQLPPPFFIAICFFLNLNKLGRGMFDPTKRTCN